MKHSFFLLFLIAIAGCKSFDPNYLNGGEPSFNPKLPAVESYVENNLVAIISPNGSVLNADPQDVITVFNREISEKMTDPYGDKKGYIVLKVNTIKSPMGIGVGWIVLSCYTACLANVFGAPFGSSKSVVEVQIDVMDKSRRLIGSYRGSGSQKIKSSFYGGNNYKLSELGRTAYLFSVKKAIKEAKTKMLPDVERLKKELEK